MKFQLLIALLVVFGITSKANAFIELKGGYSLLNSNPTNFNDFTFPAQEVKSLQGVTADVLLDAAILPISIGARYEDFAFDKGSGATQSKVDFQRISVVLNKRIIDSSAYLGVVATVGVSNEFKDKLNNNKASGSLSGSLGLEAGIKFGGIFMAGIEGGYLVAPLGDLKTSTGTTVTSGGSAVTVDMSGVYGRGVIGLTF